MLAKAIGPGRSRTRLPASASPLSPPRSLICSSRNPARFERRLKRYLHPDLLILDELGYLPCDTRAADLLYNIVNRRHEDWLHRESLPI